MAPFAAFAMIGHIITALVCTAITLIVALQLRRDAASRAFAGLTGVIAAIAFCGILIRISGLRDNAGVYELLTLAGVFTSAMPVFLFLFTAEYFNDWTHGRRWIARILIAAMSIAVMLCMFRRLIYDADVSPEGFLTYSLEPLATAMLGLGELGVLFSLQIVFEQYRKKRPELNFRFLAGIGMVCAGILLLAVPGLNKYTIEQKLYAIGSVILLGPVLQQRLLDPLTQLNVKLARRADQFRIITTVVQQATSLLSLDALLNAVVNEIQRAFGYDTVAIYLPDGADNARLVARVATGANAGMFISSTHRRTINLAELDSLLISHRQPGKRPKIGKQTTMSFPLNVGSSAAAREELVGLMDVQGKQADALTLEDLEVINILTRQIGIAIRNAELFEEAQKARRQADEANRHKTQFLSSMSHELRTPLQTIITHSQWMLKYPTNYGDVPLPDAYATDMAKITKAGKHLQQLIASILDLSKIEAGELELLIQPVDPLPILHDVQDTYINSLPQGVMFRATYSEQLPKVLGDDLRIMQILGNLVSNACKFCQQGHITLDVTVQENVVRFSVSDTGPGISVEAQPLLFSRFKQANRSVAREHGGTGLGLSIAQQLVHLHGGEIGFESIEGHGATFFFTIPLAPTENVSNSAASSGRLSTRVTFFERNKKNVPHQVLIIDSHEDSRSQVADAMVKSGFKPLAVDTAPKGVAVVTAASPACAIVVIHPDSRTEIAELPRLLRQKDTLIDTLVIEVRTDQPDWDQKLSEKLRQSLNSVGASGTMPEAAAQTKIPGQGERT